MPNQRQYPIHSKSKLFASKFKILQPFFLVSFFLPWPNRLPEIRAACYLQQSRRTNKDLKLCLLSKVQQLEKRRKISSPCQIALSGKSIAINVLQKASRDFKLGGRWEENVEERGRNASGENETGRVRERRNGRKGWKHGENRASEEAGSTPEWQSRLHFGILGSKTILSCSPSFPLYSCLSAYPITPPPPPTPWSSHSYFPPHLSVSFFPSLNNLLQQGRVEVRLFCVCLRFKQNA